MLNFNSWMSEVERLRDELDSYADLWLKEIIRSDDCVDEERLLKSKPITSRQAMCLPLNTLIKVDSLGGQHSYYDKIIGQSHRGVLSRQICCGLIRVQVPKKQFIFSTSSMACY